MTSTPASSKPEFLIFVRHGQTDWNAEGRMQGQKDIPLNSIGEGQASGNGERLKAFLEAEGLSASYFDWVASPLGRTRATMERIRTAMGLLPEDYRLDDVLKEISFGDWEGFTLEELADEEQDLIVSRRADKWGFVPPRGESYAMLSVRIAGWLRTVVKPTVVVAHGGVFRVLRGLLEELDPAVIPKLDVPQDKVFVWRGGQFIWV